MIQTFQVDYLPEIGEARFHISMTHFCWYNDSFDNHLTVDRVPGMDGLIAATSGVAILFPVLGTGLLM